MATLIEPKVLKGFRDFLPDREAARLSLVRRLEQVFRSYGFAPIDTPVLEYAEVLLGKGGGETDKQVYRFTDHGGRDVAMRYDLTVPFARFMAAHLGELALPFKRWHAAKVWRGENTQRGRYREFVQVDFDTVGTDSASADLEILLLMRESFLSLGLGGVKVHYAHRGVFNAFLSRLGLAGQSVEVLRAIDKERKIGPEKTREILAEIAGGENADRILAYSRVEASAALTRAKLAEAAASDAPGAKRLAQIGLALEDIGVADTFVLDPSITRGLDYYTGIVFETFLDRLPGIGSVCSGGRYDDLASLYTSQHLPGVGASIGLDRLMAAMEELGEAGQATAGPSVLVLMLEEGLLAEYHRIGAAFRGAGIPAEVYPEPRKLAVQFAYAEKRGIPLAVIAGSDERAKGAVNLKDLRSRESFDGLSLEDATARASALLR
ncbi:MAG: histidine--tRNA ligase [Spirochaetes bacterium RBG_13_68_11]|nr:MAG: histidine--tRNA ligase [Spirochaetes bacterium RBG_13_68_11]